MTGLTSVQTKMGVRLLRMKSQMNRPQILQNPKLEIPVGEVFSVSRQIALYSSCAQLVDDDGSLTSEGERALGSIRSGALLAGGAGLLPALGNPVTPGIIIRGLDALEEPTGCGGIVKMDILHQSATWVQY